MNQNEVEKIQDDPRYPKLGSILSNCKISSIIGIGAVAVIYKSFEIDLEMQRAIKILKPDSIDFLRKKFETEAKVTARLDHPNIVKVHGSGIYDGRLPFIHMEFIDGKSLRQLLQAHNVFPPAVCVAIVAIVALALEYAYGRSFSVWGHHSEKLVHRDLKPENILIANDGTLKVMDFGLVQFEDGKKQGAWGTPAYMSPEQIDHGRADLRNDLYSLGILLYEMLSGTRPFPDDEGKSTQLKKDGQYQPIRSHNPAIALSICEIVDKCLKPDPEDRYRTYESLRSFAVKALGEITSRSPADICKSYFENPDDFHLLQRVSSGELKSKPWFKKLKNPVIIAGTVIVAGFGIWFGSKNGLFNKTIKKTTVQKSSQVLPEDVLQNPTDSSFVERADSANFKQPRDVVTRVNVPSAVSTKINSQKKQEQPNVKSSILAETVKFWKSQNFSAVIANVNNMQIDTLSTSVRDSALIMLVDALYASRAVPEILEISSRYSVNDARYYTVLAYANEIFQDFQAASNYIDKAIVAPIHIGPQSRSSLLYDRALFYKRHFEKNRDETGKNIMLEAYRRFITESCLANSPQCEEAKKVVHHYE